MELKSCHCKESCVCEFIRHVLTLMVRRFVKALKLFHISVTLQRERVMYGFYVTHRHKVEQDDSLQP